MKKYCYIQHPHKGRILFKLFPFQEKVLTLFKENKYTITNKSRQLGISTLIAAYSMWLMLFHKDKNILALATTQTTARNLVRKVQFMYQNLPKWLKIPHEENNKLSLVLTNGSRIRAASSNSDASRSEAVSLLIIDEAAFIDNIEDTFTSAQQTLATGGQCVAVSCVIEDTYVNTSKGIQQVKDFIQNKDYIGPVEIPSYNIQGMETLRQGSLFYNNGKVPTKKIKTRYSILEGSLPHKVYASTTKGFHWSKLEDLSVGDFIAVAGGYRIWGNRDITNFTQRLDKSCKRLDFDTRIVHPDLSYLFGLYIAGGSSDNKYYIDIVCGDSQDIDVQLHKLNLPYSKQDNYLGKRLSYINLVDLFKHVGFDLDNTAERKVIPKRLLQMSEKNIIGLLQGLFDGNGTVTSEGTIGYTSVSKELVLQIRAILLNLGIYTNLYTRTAEETNKYVTQKLKEGAEWTANWNEHKHDAYILEMYGEDSKKFADLIGFRVNRKQKKLDTYIKAKLQRVRTNIKHIIPNSRKFVQDLQERSKLSQGKFARTTGLSLSNILNRTTPRFTDNVSVKNLNIIYEKWKHLLTEEEIKKWNAILDPHLRWVPVQEIIDSENYTYDFSLPEIEGDSWCHSVLYNGVLGHQTPNGIGNWFHRTFTKAQTKENSFLPIRLDWKVHPERDQSWRDQQDSDLGPKMASQECDAEFTSSGNTVIESEDITFFETTQVQEPIEKRGLEGSYWIWDLPDYTRSYIIGVDVARGDGSDFSAFQILDIETLEQVGEYKGKIGASDFGNFLVAVGTEYNNALLVIENANLGWSTVEQVIKRDYANLFYSSTSQNETIESYLKKHENDKLVPGFTNSTKTRPLIISKLVSFLRERGITIRSKRLIHELRTFIWKNGKAQAASGYNDDLVLAYAIALFVRDTALITMQQGQDLIRAQLKSLTKLNTRKEEVYTRHPQNQQNPYEITVGNRTEDITWLL